MVEQSPQITKMNNVVISVHSLFIVFWRKPKFLRIRSFRYENTLLIRFSLYFLQFLCSTLWLSGRFNNYRNALHRHRYHRHLLCYIWQNISNFASGLPQSTARASSRWLSIYPVWKQYQHPVSIHFSYYYLGNSL